MASASELPVDVLIAVLVVTSLKMQEKNIPTERVELQAAMEAMMEVMIETMMKTMLHMIAMLVIVVLARHLLVQKMKMPSEHAVTSGPWNKAVSFGCLEKNNIYAERYKSLPHLIKKNEKAAESQATKWSRARRRRRRCKRNCTSRRRTG